MSSGRYVYQQVTPDFATLSLVGSTREKSASTSPSSSSLEYCAKQHDRIVVIGIIIVFVVVLSVERTCCCCVWDVLVSMHLFIACLLACISLHSVGALGGWEVINDVKEFDDSGTQDDILSREELLPFKASKTKSKPASKVPARNVDSPKTKQMTKAPGLQPKGGNFEGEEELLPLGVGNHNNRRLLQVFAPVQGPKLPQELELQKTTFRPETVNLSTACEESDDTDCLFDVEEYVAKQITNGALEKIERDFGFADKKEDIVQIPDVPKEMPLSRRKRQTLTEDNLLDEGSGVSSVDSVYNTTDYTNEGEYYVNTQIGFQVNKTNMTDEEQIAYQKEIENTLNELFKDTLPGFTGVIVEPPTIDENGVLSANISIVIDGSLLSENHTNSLAANEIGTMSLEEYLLASLRNASDPYNNMTINVTDTISTLLDQYKLGEAFINKTRDLLSDYCNSVSPCPDSPEFNVTACINTGFMSGYCPHKCQDYPCENGALCELDDNYDPFCNCGDLYTGLYCETAQTTGDEVLTTGETVGVGLAGFAVACALLSCCLYLLLCRKNSGVEYTYYEDEGYQDNVSDPTNVANWYIDRPIISTTPIAVFNSDGFEA